MANKSGLGGSNLWVYIDEVEKEFEAYAAAHQHYINAGPGDVTAYGPVTMGSHAHGVVKEGWQQNYVQPSYAGVPASHDHHSWSEPQVQPLEFEQAKPFIEAVVERMLDLMESEEHWVKGIAHDRKGGTNRWCLIGAQGQALKELGLNQAGMSAELETARKRVLVAINNFFNQAVLEHGYSSMPSFNDDDKTSFEDIRLWLKSLFDRL
jgi:hypothetical protein